jgi:WD40 repeat protein
LCAFEQLRPYITRTEEQIAQLRRIIEEQAAMIRDLRLAVVQPSSPQIEKTEAKPAKPQQEEVEEEARQRWLAGLDCQKTLTGHQRGVTSLHVWKETRFLASGSLDATILLWPLRLEAAQPIAVLIGHDLTVWCLTSWGRYWLFSGSADGSIRCWRAPDALPSAPSPQDPTGGFACTAVLRAHASKVYALAVAHELGRMFSAGADRSIKAWNLAEPRTHDAGGASAGAPAVVVQSVARAHDEAIWNLQLSAGSGHLLSASEDKKIRIWLAASLECVASLDCGRAKVLALALADAYIFAATQESTIQVWDARSYELVRTLQV